jgi:hypothetical protein
MNNMTIKWDYLTVSADIDPTKVGENGKAGMDPKMINDMLAQFGGQGWELVNILTINTNGSTIQASFIFKKLGGEKTESQSRSIGFDLNRDGLPG